MFLLFNQLLNLSSFSLFKFLQLHKANFLGGFFFNFIIFQFIFFYCLFSIILLDIKK